MPQQIEASETEKMEKRSNEIEMSATAQVTLRDYAGHRWPTLNHKGRIGRLAGVLGFGHRRVRSLYQNEPGVRLRADEMAAIEGLRTKDDGANADDFMALQARVARLEAALAAVDEAFFDPQMAAYRQGLHVGRGGNVPGVTETED